jgi:hypothetical protein
MRERVGTFKNRKITPHIHILYIILWYDSMCFYVTHQCTQKCTSMFDGYDGLSAHVVIFNGYVLYYGKKTTHI